MKPDTVESQLRELSPREPGARLDERIRRSLDQAVQPRHRWTPFWPYAAAAIPVTIMAMLGAWSVLAGVPDDTPTIKIEDRATTKFDDGPTIKFDQEHIHLGMLPQDEIVSKMIRVSNTGDRPLEIEQVRTSCACTFATFERLVLLPGQETNMIVNIDPAKVKHPYTTKRLVVFSNDPLRPQAQIDVSAESASAVKSLGNVF